MALDSEAYRGGSGDALFVTAENVTNIAAALGYHDHANRRINVCSNCRFAATYIVNIYIFEWARGIEERYDDMNTSRFLSKWRRCRLVLFAMAAICAAFCVPAAKAIAIGVDLGSTGIVNSSRTVDLLAPNVQFQGQNIVFDFSFQNGEFIRQFTATKFFQMDAFFRINNAPLPPLNFTGSGYLTDNLGGQLGPAVSLQAFPVTDLVNEVGVDFLLRPLNSDAVPADVYGIHLDLTLPNSPAFGFGDGPPGGVTFDGNVFGIGPGVPRDIVPDTGSTLLLLSLGSLIPVVARMRLARAG